DDSTSSPRIASVEPQQFDHEFAAVQRPIRRYTSLPSISANALQDEGVHAVKPLVLGAYRMLSAGKVSNGSEVDIIYT
ncbi:hypothetical protein Pmar_PMAR014552, partial [Perkinsus marinus ATCC 50983]